MSLTHDQLIAAARIWLRDQQRCAVVLTEMVNGSGETPDAIGWRGAHTIVVECKISRADFLADAKKPFRMNASGGMGDYRYFLAPSGLIEPHDLPLGWGLLEPTPRSLRIVARSHGVSCWCEGLAHASPSRSRDVKAHVTYCLALPEKSHRSEAMLLLSLARRLKGVGIRGRATADIREYTLDEHGREVPQ